MEDFHPYLTPDYYSRFACKIDACRTACCNGWSVSLSMSDYFNLLGVECSPELRKNLDVALRMEDHPTADQYASIQHRYDGTCPLRRLDGRCAVHAELGEDALSAVCRLYPRAVRANGVYERSCAGSCEAVVEILLHHPEPIAFLYQNFRDEAGFSRGSLALSGETARKQAVRLELIRLMQDRSRSLPARLATLGRLMYAMSNGAQAAEPGEISAFSMDVDAAEVEITPDTLELGLRTVEQFAGLLDRRSESLRKYGDEALAYFGADGREMERYEQGKRRFETAFPDWEVFCENLLVNHMFYSQFPFADGGESIPDEFSALCAVYALLRFLFVGWMSRHDGEEALVDLTAAAFRLIDHTLFHRYAARILRELGADSLEKLELIAAL